MKLPIEIAAARKREAKSVPTNKIHKLQQMTDRNNHTGALLLLAEMMGNKREMRKLEHIDSLHDLYGHLVRPLQVMRNDTRDELYDQAKKVRYSDGSTLYDHIP